MKKNNLVLAGAFALVPAVAFAQADNEPYQPYEPNEPATTQQELDTGADDVDVDIDAQRRGADDTLPTPTATVTTEESTSTISPDSVLGRLGQGVGLGAVKVGVGSGDFTQANAREQTGIGPSWDVRGVFGAHSPIGVEAAYVGSSRGLGQSGVLNTQLMSNGAEGALRVAAPIRAGDIVDVRPFAFGGLGWQYMTLWGDGAVDGARDDGDHILTVPAGVGLELGLGPVNVDVRGTYRHAVGSDIFGDAGAGFGDPDALHSYNVGAGLGFEF